MTIKQLEKELKEEYFRLEKYLYEEGYCEDEDEEWVDETYYRIKGRIDQILTIIHRINNTKQIKFIIQGRTPDDERWIKENGKTRK